MKYNNYFHLLLLRSIAFLAMFLSESLTTDAHNVLKLTRNKPKFLTVKNEKLCITMNF